MGKWHNYQFLKKRVAGERTPCPSCGVVPCLADVPRNTTGVWNFGESGTIKKRGCRDLASLNSPRVVI
jgi:hypothetical protein